MKFEQQEELKRYIITALNSWDAVQDMPWPLFYRELYELFPEAYFILTIRDPKSWVASVVQYFASIRIPLHQKIYGVPCAEGNEKEYLRVYQQHNDDVQRFFANNPRFKVMHLKHDFNYETLGAFLGVTNLPIGEFPHGRNNGNRVLPRYKWYRDTRSLYWNYKKKY